MNHMNTPKLIARGVLAGGVLVAGGSLSDAAS